MKGHKQSKPAKTPKLSDLPLKWQVFLMAWLTNGGNAIQAATQAGIKAPESSAYRVLENARFKAVKNQMVADRLASKETLLLRLGEMFSHNPAMFLINQFGKWRLNTKVFKEKAYLVRRFQVNPDGSVSIDPITPSERVQAALAIAKLGGWLQEVQVNGNLMFGQGAQVQIYLPEKQDVKATQLGNGNGHPEQPVIELPPKDALPSGGQPEESQA